MGNAVGNVHQSLNTLYSSPLGKLLCLETELKNINPTSLWSQWAASQRQDLQRLEGTKDLRRQYFTYTRQRLIFRKALQIYQQHLIQKEANISLSRTIPAANLPSPLLILA